MDYKPTMEPSADTPKEQYMALRAARTGLVLDQIAFYARDETAATAIKASLGLEHADWTQDTVTGTATVWGREPTFSKALLQFNYDLGIEVEILTYLDGPHWHEETIARLGLAEEGFQSHIGFHVNDGDLPDLPFPVAQELVTETHTNPGTMGRRYHYRIFDARSTTGGFLKYIKRVL